MTTVIVDYNAGNLRSVLLAVERAGGDAIVTQAPKDVLSAERVIFPGVGAARAAMKELAHLGLDATIRDVIARGTPVLGICLGTQIILDESEEDGGTPCLGIIAGRATRFPEGDHAPPEARKVPHMGWNAVRLTKTHPVFEDIEEGDEFYFVHSYYPSPVNEGDIVATTEYGIAFASVLGRGNLIAVQFHPERSGRAGIRVIKNFLTWNGEDRA